MLTTDSNLLTPSAPGTPRLKSLRAGRSTRKRARLLLALAALVAAVTLAPSPAGATGARHRSWERFESPLGRIYGNTSNDDGFVAITGGTIADVCAGTPPEIAPGVRRQNAGGTWRIKTVHGGFRTAVSVYETDLPIFEFIPVTCEAQAKGQPLPDPFATGDVVLRDSIRNVADGSAGFETQLPGRYRNGLRGTVRTVDGSAYRLRILVDFEINSDGSFSPFQDVFTLKPRGRHHS